MLQVERDFDPKVLVQERFIFFDNAIGGVEVYNLPLAFVAAFLVNVATSLIVPQADSSTAPAEEA